ncbi:hypothetical protein AAMO2058_000348200 [Amorphochlora amoebiformis]
MAHGVRESDGVDGNCGGHRGVRRIFRSASNGNTASNSYKGQTQTISRRWSSEIRGLAVHASDVVGSHGSTLAGSQVMGMPIRRAAAAIGPLVRNLRAVPPVRPRLQRSSFEGSCGSLVLEAGGAEGFTSPSGLAGLMLLLLVLVLLVLCTW